MNAAHAFAVAGSVCHCARVLPRVVLSYPAGAVGDAAVVSPGRARSGDGHRVADHGALGGQPVAAVAGLGRPGRLDMAWPELAALEHQHKLTPVGHEVRSFVGAQAFYDELVKVALKRR